ncbi:hypothetical protein A5N17_06865 [Arthrobacter sp. D2]|nr:hypothetical protein [Arthrobacter sp. M5]NKR17179.1 hypothetical protein [Arthrobacter sp. M6]OEH61859.1 hypothetical protein A5N13_15885 [Arthrobacter sp. D4]OEH64161.1 hypothetical protein A5N17_06865 [Arthrobacter sp. D2]
MLIAFLQIVCSLLVALRVNKEAYADHLSSDEPLKRRFLLGFFLGQCNDPVGVGSSPVSLSSVILALVPLRYLVMRPILHIIGPWRFVLGQTGQVQVCCGIANRACSLGGRDELV